MARSVDILKSFKRVGQFPEYTDDIYTTLEAAEEYAKKGIDGQSSAYPGQLIRVVPKDNSQSINVYIIDRNFKLNPLLHEFDYTTQRIGIRDISELPTFGVPNTLYIIPGDDKGYVFNEDESIYKTINLKELIKIDEINGGIANGR